jgi:hypothetical protein
MVVVGAIAVPVIRDCEGGVLNPPRTIRQAQQVVVSGVWQIAILAVESVCAPYRIQVAIGVAAGTTGVESSIGGADLVGIVESLVMLGEEMSQWDSPHPRENAKNHQNKWKLCT